MAIIVYGLKNCDSCKQAMGALKAAGLDPRFHDVRAEPLAPESLTDLLNQVGIERLVNTRSTTWRGLDPSEQALSTLAEALVLLLKYPTLIKRPVIAAGNAVFVGWSVKGAASLIEEVKQALPGSG